ncbi:MAG: DUF420 domain-containing protein [Gemmataceae bacterium]|nr:DUF420 domain-containing protein [Gemmataceae bacterium]
MSSKHIHIVKLHWLWCVLLFFYCQNPATASDPPNSLYPDWDHSVAPFALTERSGKTVTPDDLRGKVWVAHFFFTRCLGGCAVTTAHMSRLNGLFEDSPDIALVSITVDPEHDTPEVLKRHADQHFAGAQWLFLTAKDKAQDIHDVVQKSFFQTAGPAQDKKHGFEFDHSFALVVVDREGKIRGYVDGRKLDEVDHLERRVRQLARGRYVLPSVNATLNGLCFALLVMGYLAIRAKQESLHKFCMLAALVVSIAFLVCYLYFHFVVLEGKPTRFRGEGLVRYVYFAILISHTALAAVVAPLALYTAYQGLRDHRPRHVKVARWTLPIWLYVSLTGVVVYWMLYHLYPPV